MRHLSFAWLRRLSRAPLLAAVAAVGLSAAPWAAMAQITTFSTPGSGTYTVPAGVTRIHVEAWGGGGGGINGTLNSGGGGGGAYATAVLTVVPGAQISYAVGAAAGLTKQAALLLEMVRRWWRSAADQTLLILIYRPFVALLVVLPAIALPSAERIRAGRALTAVQMAAPLPAAAAGPLRLPPTAALA